MTTLTHALPPVQPTWADIRIAALPETLDAVEPFMSPEDVLGHTAYDEALYVAFGAAYDGEPARAPGTWPRERAFAFTRFGDKGKAARAIADARELGYRMGRADSISEPAAGYSADEAAAFRAGRAEGLAYRNDVIARWTERGFWQSTLAERARQEWLDEAFDALPPREFELCPGGVC